MRTSGQCLNQSTHRVGIRAENKPDTANPACGTADRRTLAGLVREVEFYWGRSHRITFEIPDWVTFPEDDWVQITTEEAGLDAEEFEAFLAGLEIRGASYGGEDHAGNKYGAVIVRGGYLIHAWGDRHYRHHTASVGKAFIWAILGFAVADGLIDPDKPINKYWVGEGQLSHPHKVLSQGHHKKLTWRHLVGPKHESLHYGGFPMEMGVRWREKVTGLEQVDVIPGVPEWSNWTGDPFYDLYSHVEPGTVGHYSSAGFWKLGQALTHVWDRYLRDVLQERLFDRIGIPAERWDWLAGRYIKDQKYFYPAIPDSYTYLAPPMRSADNPSGAAPDGLSSQCIGPGPVWPSDRDEWRLAG